MSAFTLAAGARPATASSPALADGARAWQPGYPREWEPVLVGRFLLRHARSRPDATAIISHGVSHTYAELEHSATRWRERLAALGLRHGDAVAALMEPGFESASLLIACGELGCVFVPFNADLPEARVVGICRQIDAKLLVLGPGAQLRAERAARITDRWAVTQGSDAETHGGPVAGPGPHRKVLESDIAYIIFTSGSTGTPKGVVMSHRAAVVAFRAIAAACDVRGRLGSVAPLGFDLSLLDTAAALGVGATIVYVPRQVALHPRRLFDELAAQRIRQMHSVPTLWSMMLKHCGDRLGELRDLQRIVVGGEELTVATVNALRARLPALEVVNLYGQTESICCAFYPVPNPVPAGWASIPIGTAYPGAEMLLFDERGDRVTAEGAPGEIYLRAASMFQGYWRDAETTGRVLVPDPERPDSGERLLRTGDLAVLGPGGLAFAGRRDHQVQVHGNRVELEEIERCLARAHGVRVAGVTDVREGDSHLIVAFVVVDDPGAADSAGLREHCRADLPPYMVPARFVFAEALPESASGKVDRKALGTLWSTHTHGPTRSADDRTVPVAR